MTHPIHSAVHVCFDRDIECGDFERNWCATCPKRKPIHSADAERAAIYRESEAFEIYWKKHQECPEHSLTTKNCANATWHARAAMARAAAQVGANGAAESMTDKLQRLQGASVKHIARLAAGAPADLDTLHFNAQRLRNVAHLVGLQGAIPEDDAALDGARGAVLGQIAGKLRAAGAPAETPKPATVWIAANRTSSAVFATSEAAGQYVSSFSPSVAGGISIIEVPVIGATPAATIGAGEGKDAEDADPATKQGKLLALADRIDHEKLWRLAGMDHHKLTSDQKDRMNAGVALRRYADIWAPGHWVVVPPVGGIQFGASTLDKAVEMAKRDDVRRAAMRSKTSPGEAG